MTKSPSDAEIGDLQTRTLVAFGAVLQAEEVLRVAEVALRDQAAALSLKVAEAETALRDAWLGVEQIMQETGEVELLLPGEAGDYKIAYGASRESVKCESVDAVPDEFVRLERKPKLKEIGDHLKGLRAIGSAMPNWAALERKPGRLAWKLVKKKASAVGASQQGEDS